MPKIDHFIGKTARFESTLPHYITPDPQFDPIILKKIPGSYQQISIFSTDLSTICGNFHFLTPLYPTFPVVQSAELCHNSPIQKIDNEGGQH